MKNMSLIIGKKINVVSAHDYIREKARIVSVARAQEYKTRLGGLKEETIFKNVFYGFLAEYSVWMLIKENIQCDYISDPDFDLHENNNHPCDLLVAIDGKEFSVSVKCCSGVAKDKASWVYQADRLPMNESLHFLVFGYLQPESDYCEIKYPPAIFEVFAIKTPEQIKTNLKKTRKPSVGKMAVYYEDINNGN